MKAFCRRKPALCVCFDDLFVWTFYPKHETRTADVCRVLRGDPIRSWDKSSVYLFFSGWQELCLAWRWAEVTSVQGSPGTRLSQRQGCGRNALPTSHKYLHLHSSIHLDSPAFAFLLLCYISFVIKVGGVGGGLLIHLYYNIWVNILKM